jgi:hypothetical protein
VRYGEKPGTPVDKQTMEVTFVLRMQDVVAYMGDTPHTVALGHPSIPEALVALKDDGLIELLRHVQEGRPKEHDDEQLRRDYQEWRAGRNGSRRRDYNEYARHRMGAETEPEIRAAVQALRRALKVQNPP